MPSHFPSLALFPALSLQRLQHPAQVPDPVGEDSREAVVVAAGAAGGRVERKSRIGDYGVADHAPIEEVCAFAGGIADFRKRERCSNGPATRLPEGTGWGDSPMAGYRSL